jgi:sulfite oxidase
MGAGLKETVFTLDQLKAMPKVDVTTVIQCNGNRREDFQFIDGLSPAFGPPHWVAGAIGNATWTGVRLRDVLRVSGMDVDAISLGKMEAPKEATAVGLLGYDHDEVGNQYCCSFPFEKAIDPFGDVILAYEMNGEPIPRSHGFPVRAIVPGNAGARNCKFLERVTVTNTPCCDSSNWKQYAVHAPDVPLSKLCEFEVYATELKKDPAVQEMPVQSMITSPSAGDLLAIANSDAPSVKVKGVAWGGGGQGINRVDVSADGGQNFTRAELLPSPLKQRRGSQWAWVFFERDIPLSDDVRQKIKSGQAVDLELTSKVPFDQIHIVDDLSSCCILFPFRH